MEEGVFLGMEFIIFLCVHVCVAIWWWGARDLTNCKLEFSCGSDIFKICKAVILEARLDEVGSYKEAAFVL